MAKLPEQLQGYHPVLGTSKRRNIDRFKEIYGEVASVDAEQVNDVYIPEPRDVDPTVPARFKTRRVLEGFQDEPEKKVVAFGTDVVFVNGKRHLKPEVDETTEAAVVEETVAWYCTDSFIVHWLIAFSIHTNDGLRRLGVLDVEGQYLEPLEEVDVRAEFNTKMNARVPLVEAGAEGKAQFTVSNMYYDEKVPISYELAEQLIVDRVLPLALLQSLLEEEAISYEDEGEVWDVVMIDVIGSLISRQVLAAEYLELVTYYESLPRYNQQERQKVTTELMQMKAELSAYGIITTRVEDDWGTSQVTLFLENDYRKNKEVVSEKLVG